MERVQIVRHACHALRSVSKVSATPTPLPLTSRKPDGPHFMYPFCMSADSFASASLMNDQWGRNHQSTRSDACACSLYSIVAECGIFECPSVHLDQGTRSTLNSGIRWRLCDEYYRWCGILRVLRANRRVKRRTSKCWSTKRAHINGEITNCWRNKSGNIYTVHTLL